MGVLHNFVGHPLVLSRCCTICGGHRVLKTRCFGLKVLQGWRVSEHAACSLAGGVFMCGYVKNIRCVFFSRGRVHVLIRTKYTAPEALGHMRITTCASNQVQGGGHAVCDPYPNAVPRSSESSMGLCSKHQGRVDFAPHRCMPHGRITGINFSL